MKNILSAPFIKEMCDVTANMYRLGWNERNGGNISYMLDENEVAEYLDTNSVIREIPFMGVGTVRFDATALSGKIFLVTGTGKYFKNVEKDPETNLGIVKIADNGAIAQLLWGFKDGGRFTSEFPAHMLSHMARLAVEPKNRIIMHCHPTNLLAMTRVHKNDDKSFSKDLWKTCTEGIVVYPEGVGVLPWMLCGTLEIGLATADKMKDYRLVVWGIHGLYAAGSTMDEAFGLIETVEKCAELYMKTAHLPLINTITDDDLKITAAAFGVKYKDGWLD